MVSVRKFERCSLPPPPYIDIYTHARARTHERERERERERDVLDYPSHTAKHPHLFSRIFQEKHLFFFPRWGGGVVLLLKYALSVT